MKRSHTSAWSRLRNKARPDEYNDDDDESMNNILVSTVVKPAGGFKDAVNRALGGAGDPADVHRHFGSCHAHRGLGLEQISSGVDPPTLTVVR